LNENIQAEKLKKKNQETTIWNKEMAISEHYDKCERSIIDYTRLCTSLKLLPSSAKYAYGCNYELSLHQNQLKRDPKVDIKQQFEEFVEDARKKDLETWNTTIENYNLLESITDAMRAAQYDVQCLEEEERRLEKHRVDRKSYLEGELNKTREQRDNIRHQLEERRANQLEDMTKCEESSEKAKKEFYELQTVLQQKYLNAFQKTYTTLEALNGYKANAQGELNSFKQHVNALIETAL